MKYSEFSISLSNDRDTVSNVITIVTHTVVYCHGGITENVFGVFWNTYKFGKQRWGSSMKTFKMRKKRIFFSVTVRWRLPLAFFFTGTGVPREDGYGMRNEGNFPDFSSYRHQQRI